MPNAGGPASRAMPGEGDPEVQQFADALLAFLTAARRTRGRLQPLFDDITVPQLVMLDAVEAYGRDGVVAVATYAGVTQPTVTRAVAALEQDGLVRRAAGDRDRRTRILVLTKRGEKLLADKRAVVGQHLSQAWDGLDPTERRLAAPLLRHLAELVGRLL